MSRNFKVSRHAHMHVHMYFFFFFAKSCFVIMNTHIFLFHHFMKLYAKADDNSSNIKITLPNQRLTDKILSLFKLALLEASINSFH